MSKLIITVMNGIGGFKGPKQLPGHPVQYLSHVVNQYMDSAAGILALKGIEWYRIEGKGGLLPQPEQKIYDLLTSKLEPGDVWLAIGFSYGVRDTCERLVKRFNDASPVNDIYRMLLTFDGDYAGRVALAALPGGKKLREKPEPGPLVEYHQNRYQRSSFTGGWDLRPNIVKRINPKTGELYPAAYNTGTSVLVDWPKHGTFDTCPAVKDCVVEGIKAAAAIVKARNK